MLTFDHRDIAYNVSMLFIRWVQEQFVVVDWLEFIWILLFVALFMVDSKRFCHASRSACDAKICLMLNQ